MFLCWWAGVRVEVGNGESRTGERSQEAQVLERSATKEKMTQLRANHLSSLGR